MSDLCCCTLWQEQKPAECGWSGNNPSRLEHKEAMGRKAAAQALVEGVTSLVQVSSLSLPLVLGQFGFDARPQTEVFSLLIVSLGNTGMRTWKQAENPESKPLIQCYLKWLLAC